MSVDYLGADSSKCLFGSTLGLLKKANPLQRSLFHGRFTGRCIAKRLGRQRAARSQYLDPTGGSLFQESLLKFADVLA